MPPPDVHAYVSAIAATLRTLRSDLVGVYLHGSATLGGFRREVSDVDVLAVVRVPGTAARQRAVGEAITAVDGCPGTGLELSVITAATAAVLADCRFEVHVNTTGARTDIVPGAGRPGDPDLVLHVAVCRDHAVAVVGPPPRDVFGPVARARVLDAMLADLDWALGNASTGYAVLNACRAARFATDGRLCSKLDGGAWYLARHPQNGVVSAAVAFQRDGGPPPPAEATAEFVAGAIRLISRGDARTG